MWKWRRRFEALQKGPLEFGIAGGRVTKSPEVSLG